VPRDERPDHLVRAIGLRPGFRHISYWHVPEHHIYLIDGYAKSRREDLTPRQVKVLAELMRDLKDG